MTDRKGGRRSVLGVELKRAKKTYFVEQDKSRDSLCSLAHNLRETRFRLLKSEIYCLQNSRFKPYSARIGRKIKDTFQVAYKRI